MSKKRILNILNKEIGFLGIAFFMSILLVQCGMRGTPTGGPTDVTPPKIKRSTPQNFSTNFTSCTLVIEQ